VTQILVDTSVWIDFFNNGTSKESIILEKLITNNETLYLCPIIYQEILQGINDDKIFNEIKNILLNFSVLNNDIFRISTIAIDIYRSLRKKGITIRKSNDCLIAAYAIDSNLHLFHKDRDFANIASHLNLKLFHI
jgi:predicted nucleic acid-binding protein